MKTRVYLCEVSDDLWARKEIMRCCPPEMESTRGMMKTRSVESVGRCVPQHLASVISGLVET